MHGDGHLSHEPLAGLVDRIAETPHELHVLFRERSLPNRGEVFVELAQIGWSCQADIYSRV
jgi:hypothetical protein